MSRYHSSAQYAPSGIADSSVHEAGIRADHGRHDRDPSPSDSESSSAFNNHPGDPTDDPAAPDDPYHALTSQTLNADGTPKRPMNAFMIFARKRRPQISAANQMMRTGDVSKILSKEWNSMEMSEKKFYLDQAKKLKDNFNSKYPDYVYRRRPNNSRKKRKPEPNHDGDPSADPAHLGDPDDPAGAYDDTSPIDPDDPLGMVPSPQDVQYTRPHSQTHAHAHAHLNPSPPVSAGAGYHPHAMAPASASASNPACTYPYASDFHSAHHLASARLPHLGHSDPALGVAGTLGPIRTSSLDALSHGGYQPQPPASGSLYQNAPQQHQQHQQQQQSSLYASHSPTALWDTARSGPGGTRPDAGPGRSNWPVVLPALDTSLGRQRTIPGAGQGSLAPSHSSPQQLPARPWSSATSSSSSSASASTPHHHHHSHNHNHSHSHSHNHSGGANAFPTLTSAFFPNESPGTKAMDLAAASSPGAPGPGTPAHEYFSAGAGRRQSAEQGQQQGHGAHTGYAGPYGGSWSQHQHQQQQQQQQQYGRPVGQQQQPYSLQGSPEGGARSAASAGASGAHIGYWSDSRFGR
ncbi:hypothetical protein L226DRAFT_215000 [Lentinus tigrinus ALCF2SS1-7]|uniref:HMG box domain-containing protein n=1 Tax=Lentinus tigrinus ALCF2SS1-6 TaxID=1328759 RepID=A0A5C2RZ18_9APHY|nr:hypothetical protein L227DRAFT_284739 [Lentinus tigrinus ALCF2SS1-6]RPD71088.1 hypothetical protein L226DRAFT_215000 [Lentinus tigrinus ALCF2SS1-7]